MHQPDLFDADPQADLFGENDAPRAVYRVDPAEVRLKLVAVLDELRGAVAMPWDVRQQRYHQTVFPQMSRWLPEDEAAQLRFAFEVEMERLLAA